MKKLLFILFLTNLNAQEVNNKHVVKVIADIKLINTGNLGQSLAPMCTQGILSASNGGNAISSPLARYNKCAIDLCGVPSKNVSVFNTDTSHAQFLSKNAKKLIDEQSQTISAVIDKALDNKKRQFSALKQLIQNPQNTFGKLEYETNQIHTAAIFAKYLEITYPNSKDLKNKVSIKISAPVWADENFKKALEEHATSLKFSLLYTRGNGIHDDELSDKLSLADKKERNHTLVKIIRDETEKILKEKLNSSDEDTQSDRQNFLKTQEELTNLIKEDSNSSIDVEKIFQIASYHISKLRDLGSNVAGGTICNSPSCLDALKLYYNSPEATKNLVKYESFLNDPNTKTKAINRCTAGLINSEIEKTDQKSANELYAKASRLVKDNYISGFSAHSASLLQKYLDSSIKINDQNPTALDSAKEDKVSEFKTVANDYLKMTPFSYDKYPDTLLDYFQATQSKLEELDPIKGVHPCETYTSNLWDSFLSFDLLKDHPSYDPKTHSFLNEKDNIFISPFSCQHAAHGAHATTHEIGHALNLFFKKNEISESSAKNFKKLRACATSNYTNPQINSQSQHGHNGDSIYTEEDHADLIAFKVINDKNIYSCAFLQPSITDNSYIELDFRSDSGNPHSHSFARVLFEAINKDITLPESCKDLINEVKPEMRLEKCI